MPRQRPNGQPTKVIEHPNDPTISVTVQKPTRAASYRYRDALANHQRALQVYDKDGHELFNQDGSRAVYLLQLYPQSIVVKSMEESLINWLGINDASGAPIPFRSAEIGILFEEWLDAEVDDVVTTKDPDTGVETTKTIKVTIPFGRHINRRMGDPKLFDADPLAPTSAQP